MSCHGTALLSFAEPLCFTSVFLAEVCLEAAIALFGVQEETGPEWSW